MGGKVVRIEGLG